MSRPSAKDPFVGTRIREYDILDIIGKGGMGAVYRARHVYLDEERAIKVVHSSFARDEAFVQRFIREAKMLVKLRHPNLVQLYEFGTLGEDVFFMVLELIKGEPLLDRCHRQGRIPVEEAAKIIREAALGLHQAHQKGIVHRDISPDNLLIVKNDEGTELTKVIDFGIAKPLADQTRIFTRTNMFLGKPEFCSPEQCGALEEGEIIDHRSDIYSLGITMYYILTGKLPFYSPTPQGYLLKHINEAPTPVASHFNEGKFPEEVDRIIQKSLAKKRDQRYSTMEEFALALEEFEAGSKRMLWKPETSAPTPSSEFLPEGFVFARRYQIEKMLRKGSNGVLYKAMDRILEVPVVLRIVGKELLPDEKSITRFKRGVVLSHKVSHPNVCRIYDIGESDLGLYVSTEYIEGKLLSEVLRSNSRLHPEIAFSIIKDILMAMKEAHRVGVIHRNLKPQSIVIDADNRAHILDFAASISQTGSQLTDPRLFFGTPSYMAPEQFAEKPVDHRSDIYSIGVIMYEMFTGRLPFGATSVPSLILAHVSSVPPRPSEVIQDTHPELDRIIMKAIEKDASNRYQSVLELLADVEAIDDTIVNQVKKAQQEKKHKFKEAFERGKELYDQLRLEDAITAWREAERISPDDQMVKRCITAAENRLSKENQIRTDVDSLLSQCEQLIASRRLDEARAVLKKCEDRLTSSHRFRDLRDRIAVVARNIERS